MDDAEYIPVIKTVIEGVSKGMIGSTPTEQETIKRKLYEYSRGLYLEVWLSDGEEGEDIEKAKADGEATFDYIYKNEKHPRWN